MRERKEARAHCQASLLKVGSLEPHYLFLHIAVLEMLDLAAPYRFCLVLSASAPFLKPADYKLINQALYSITDIKPSALSKH